MDDRRTYPREELVGAMICALGNSSVATHCVVKNISLDGALVECPLAGEQEVFDVGDSVQLTDVLESNNALFKNVTGEIVWVYKKTLGLHFHEILMESPNLLREWLEGRSLT